MYSNLIIKFVKFHLKTILKHHKPFVSKFGTPQLGRSRLNVEFFVAKEKNRSVLLTLKTFWKTGEFAVHFGVQSNKESTNIKAVFIKTQMTLKKHLN